MEARLKDRLKFRVWTDDQMFYPEDGEVPFAFNQHGDLLKIDDNNVVSWARIGHTISDDEIMPCIGFRDRNDNWIYAGDIIKIGNGSINGSVFEEIIVVKWMTNKWNVPAWVADKPDCSHYIEIIGTIFENPELLNKEK